MSEVIHGMSDEDFLKTSPEDFPIDESEQAEDDSTEDNDLLDQSPQDGLNSNSEGADDVSEEDSEEEEDTEEAAEDQGTDDTEEEDSVTEDEPSDADLQYQAQLDEIMAPIKAAGREVTLKTASEARQLIQMGVDYSDKMRGMKPHLKALKMLENNGLLDEAKISYLIDLDKKNPEAISKLLKDGEIDPHDLDVSEESKYTPSDHSVSDSEVELDDVVARIRDTDAFSDTMNVVNDVWDDASKRTLVDKPAMLEALNTHMSNGTYQSVMAEVDRIKLFGGLTNLSDLEAYQQVGAQMQEKGSFNAKAQASPNKVSSKPNTVLDIDRKDKRRKAGTSKKVSSKKGDTSFDPMISLSDEDFLKKFNKN